MSSEAECDEAQGNRQSPKVCIPFHQTWSPVSKLAAAVSKEDDSKNNG